MMYGAIGGMAAGIMNEQNKKRYGHSVYIENNQSFRSGFDLPIKSKLIKIEK